ncbi:hypothetical protein [Hymenobacter volaticus]|uniref:Uncharacterized protein n=1 Tax=Hymenobacter volaticus TaxID=2932254 RepID=A0ABY4GDK5_9BACT|nr:hypothetical protein [Hymenobacter volaticus]UOQ68991.1 hypothetical protein MUN86_26155 [Hymenobacter volaticus]
MSPFAAGYMPLDVEQAVTAGPAFGMGRYVYVPGLMCQSKFYAPPAIRGRAVLAARALRLHFRSVPDGVNLVLDRTHLLPGWVGTYALRSNIHPGAPIRGLLCYHLAAAAGHVTNRLVLGACVPSLTGGLTITDYDPQHRQLSGYYEARILAPRDLARVAGSPGPRGTLVLAGDFAALPVQML